LFAYAIFRETYAHVKVEIRTNQMSDEGMGCREPVETRLPS
jgi:hypothetical protein